MYNNCLRGIKMKNYKVINYDIAIMSGISIGLLGLIGFIYYADSVIAARPHTDSIQACLVDNTVEPMDTSWMVSYTDLFDESKTYDKEGAEIDDSPVIDAPDNDTDYLPNSGDVTMPHVDVPGTQVVPIPKMTYRQYIQLLQRPNISHNSPGTSLNGLGTSYNGTQTCNTVAEPGWAWVIGLISLIAVKLKDFV